MTVDEMDLASQALDVTPWRPEEYERARAVLRGAMAESGPRPVATRVQERGARHRWPRGGKVGIGAGAAAAAAAVAVVLATSAPQPTAPGGSVPRPPAATAKLVTLAALIKANNNGSLPGNASLVIDKQVIGGKLMQVVYALYTDSGRLYTGDGPKSLRAAAAGQANQADGTNAREIAAARYAATGDLATARVRMANALPNCFGLGLPPAAQQKLQAKCWAAGAAERREIEREKGIKTPLKQPTGQALQDEISNFLWTASTIALSWGAGNPAIREGVLRLWSTIPGVTVANSATGGQATLTITAGPDVFGGEGNQVLTINARTGMPIKSVVAPGGSVPVSVETYQVSRVSIEAGQH